MEKNELSVFSVTKAKSRYAPFGRVVLGTNQSPIRFISLLVMAFFMFSSAVAYGQEKKITGTVIDGETDAPFPGVNILIKGTTSGTITDFDGNFTLTVPGEDAILEFSFVGYIAQSVPVAGKTTLSVKLAPDTKSLDEVVVVGYGTMKKSDVTGSIVSIKEDDFKQVKSTNVVESLQGKAAGVDISRSSGEAGSGFSIQIRGNRSLSASGNPLYIVDGIQYGGGIDINPSDIASIEILKDVSSTAIYGARGANGVVIITTKKGVEGKPKISFSSYIGRNQPLGSLPYFDRNSYMSFRDDVARTKWYNRFGEWNDTLQATYQDWEQAGIAKGTNTNWLDKFMQDGYVQNYFVSVSGGNKGVVYNLSLDHTKESGMVQNDEFKRYVLKGGMDVKVNDYINVGTSTVLSYTDRTRMGFPEKSIRLANPLSEPYDSLGNLILEPNPTASSLTPLWYTQDGYYDREQIKTRIFSSVYADIKLFEGFNIRSTFNVDLSTTREGTFQIDGPSDESVNLYLSPGKKYTWSTVGNYGKTVGGHKFNFTAGWEVSDGNTERYNINGKNPSIPYSRWYALSGLDQDLLTVGSGDGNPDYSGDDPQYSEGSQMSAFGRATYTLNNKYVIAATYRADGSSVLADGNKWDYFPSASVSWNTSEEAFLKNVEALSVLKMRLGYGVSGNYAVRAYSSWSRLNQDALYYEFGTTESVVLGYRPTYAGNKALGWEKTASYNFGLDFGFFDNRVSGNIDVYQAETVDLLQKRTLPPSAAIPNIYDNVGAVMTKGVEVMVHGTILDSRKEGGFKWTADVSFTRSKEEITELASGVDQDLVNSWFVGHPVRVTYEREFDGIWQIGDSLELEKFGGEFVPGDIKIVDQNNDSIIDDKDRVILGQENPKWFGSFTTRFEYKGFDLSVMVMGRFGMLVQDAAVQSQPMRDDYADAGYNIGYWTPENQNNEMPRLNNKFSALALAPNASALGYVDGSWVKVRDITLGYTLPDQLLGKAKISSLRVYGSLKNAIVLYSPLYDNGNRYDPEMRGRTSWPMPKSLIFGVSLDF